MSRQRRWRGAAGSGAVWVLLATALLLGCRAEERAAAPAAGPSGAAVVSERTEVSLHFPGDDGYLHVERREMEVAKSGDERLEAVLAALLGGPRRGELLPIFESGVTLGNAYVDGHGVAYVDLNAEGQPSPPPSGSALELVRVYALVNTALANDERVRSVVLLWNGMQRQTFAGHVDTLHPLTADHKLVR
jgi:hypothetical protein